jgi:cytochrome P450
MDYCFQKDLNALSEPEFKSETIENMIKGMEVPILMIAAYFPRFSAVFDACIFALPEEVRKVYFAPVYSFQTMQRYARERVEELMRKKERGGEVESKIPTMFDAMLWPDADKGQVTPPKDDMVADGSLMIAAGTDTTANVLGTALWHVSQDKEVERKLVEELKRGIPDREDIVESARLEGQGFEYLRAVVKESLRVSYGVPGRIPRRVPKGGATFNGVFVPEGVSLYYAAASASWARLWAWQANE